MYPQTQTDSIGDSVSRSRVDMLIAIYDSAILAAEELEADLQSGSDGAVAKLQLVKSLNLIESGLDLSLGELPQRIQQICQFIEFRLVHPDADEIAACCRILRNLRDGFVGVRSDAVRMEALGEIPSVSTKSVDTLV